MKNIDHQNSNISFLSILSITIPLIFVELSNYIMMSINRIVLATVSADMMNAVSIAGNFISIFTVFFVEIIEKNSILASQFYGDKKNDKISVCVWQMIFFSLLILPIFITLSLLSDKLHNFPPNLLQYGLPYQRTVFACSFLLFIYTALTTFFIAQKKTYVISLSVVIGSSLNLFFSILLVKLFHLGTLGSAWGTVIGYIGEVIFLGCIFFNKSNRNKFQTNKISWDTNLLKKIFKLGYPIGIISSAAMIVWYTILSMVSKISQNQLTLYNILIIINLFFTYISNAMMQSVSTMAANLIAQKDLQGIQNLIKKFFKLILLAFSTFFIVLISLKQYIIEAIFSIDPGIKDCQNLVIFCFYAVVVYGSIEFLYKVFQGVCLAGGDTKFVSRINAFVIIFIDLLPIVILKYLGLLTSIWPIILVFLFEPIPLFIIYAIRYKSLKWYNKIV